MKVLLFDAANTLIHKPSIWNRIQEVLREHQHFVDLRQLKERHKILSEIINFPDRTTKEFYLHFNAELLMSLGIVPTTKVLDELFDNCTYQPWCAFEDCKYLAEIKIKKAILSNFNASLFDLVGELIGQDVFDEIFISENEKVRKPNLDFFQIAIDKLGVAPQEILYVGDSLKLDIIPAQTLGMHAMLIDRDRIYNHANEKISNFEELKKFL